MRWADNAEHGLSVYPDLDTSPLMIIRTSADHTDGRRFSGSDGTLYDESRWNPSLFESALKSVINEYLSCADKHEGIG